MLTDEDKKVMQQAEEAIFESCRDEAAKYFHVDSEKLSYKQLEDFYWIQSANEMIEEEIKEAELSRTSAETALGVECGSLSHDKILLWRLQKSLNGSYARIGDEIVYFKE